MIRTQDLLTNLDIPNINKMYRNDQRENVKTNLREHEEILVFTLDKLGSLFKKLDIDYRLGGILNAILYPTANQNSQSGLNLFREHHDLDVIIDYKNMGKLFSECEKYNYKVCTYKILDNKELKFLPISYQTYLEKDRPVTALVPKIKINNAAKYSYDIFDILVNKSDKEGNEIIYDDIKLKKEQLTPNKFYTTLSGHKIPLSTEVDVILHKIINCRVKDIRDLHRILDNSYYGVNYDYVAEAMNLINETKNKLFINIYNDLKKGLDLKILERKYDQKDKKLFFGKMFGVSATRYILERVIRPYSNSISKEEYLLNANKVFEESQLGQMIGSVLKQK